MFDINDVFRQLASDSKTMIQLGLIFAFAITVSLGGAILQGMVKRKRRAKSAAKRSSGNAPENTLADPANQMRYVSKVGFVRQPLLNREEKPLLALIENTVAGLGVGYLVMAQTSLGEVLKPEPRSGSAQDRQMAFKSINSKRLDFAIFDAAGLLMLAVEYQGSGHYQETSFMRDAVKREALRKAGVTMVEIPKTYTPESVEFQLLTALQGTESARQ